MFYFIELEPEIDPAVADQLQQLEELQERLALGVVDVPVVHGGDDPPLGGEEPLIHGGDEPLIDGGVDDPPLGREEPPGLHHVDHGIEEGEDDDDDLGKYFY